MAQALCTRPLGEPYQLSKCDQLIEANRFTLVVFLKKKEENIFL